MNLPLYFTLNIFIASLVYPVNMDGMDFKCKPGQAASSEGSRRQAVRAGCLASKITLGQTYTHSSTMRPWYCRFSEEPVRLGNKKLYQLNVWEMARPARGWVYYRQLLKHHAISHLYHVQ